MSMFEGLSPGVDAKLASVRTRSGKSMAVRIATMEPADEPARWKRSSSR
jgi:hypothetical protein